MSSSPRYFQRRRRLLGKLRRCVRCGAFSPADGHKLCAACLEEKKLKRPEPTGRKERAEKRLAEINVIRARMLEQLGRVG